jgi:phage terminase large subunit GpA-like protein
MRLPSDVSALPGPVTLYPYQRGIADAIGDPTIERVTIVKCVRIGMTTIMTAAIGNYVANDPSPILLLNPTESDCRDHAVSVLEPVFEATPALRGLMRYEMEGGRNTLLSRRFPGGSLRLVAAKAPRNLRAKNARILFIDEADAMVTTTEGSVIKLAENRTMSFTNRKIVIGSTPLNVGTSNVLAAYEQSDKRIYEVPCPACGTYLELLWKHIEWPPNEPEKAAFRCPNCNVLSEERHKLGMVEKGIWRATAPEVQSHAGYVINALVSLLSNARWGILASEFLAAKDDPGSLQTFVNTILAQGWQEATETIDDTELSARAEPFGLDRIPPEVLQITAGIDCQGDRFEIVIIGWTRELHMLILAQFVLYCQPTDDSSWMELDALLQTRWTHPLGGQLKIDAAAVDAGDGGMFDRVLSFTSPRLNRRVVGIKGVAGIRPAIVASSTTRATRGQRLFLVGVDTIKQQIYQRLARGRTIRFSDTLEPEFYAQLASERLVLRYSKGHPVRRFERIPGRRAEALDCVGYAIAVRGIAPINFDQRESELRQLGIPPPSPVSRSAWLEGRPVTGSAWLNKGRH